MHFFIGTLKDEMNTFTTVGGHICLLGFDVKRSVSFLFLSLSRQYPIFVEQLVATPRMYYMEEVLSPVLVPPLLIFPLHQLLSASSLFLCAFSFHPGALTAK